MMMDGPMIQINYDTLVVTRSAALRLQVEHKRPALDGGHKQPPRLITFPVGKLAKLLKIEKGNCCYHFKLGGSPSLDQEAYSHIFT